MVHFSVYIRTEIGAHCPAMNNITQLQDTTYHPVTGQPLASRTWTFNVGSVAGAGRARTSSANRRTSGARGLPSVGATASTTTRKRTARNRSRKQNVNQPIQG